jgi:hypothetical protein
MHNYNKKKVDISKLYTKFVDILFAVVIGQSFALLGSPTGFKSWFDDVEKHMPCFANLMLVYVLVITSWIEYHRSISEYKEVKEGICRFVIDIILLFLYYMGFSYAADLIRILMIFTCVFGFYSAWDFSRIIEYWISNFKENRKELPKLKELFIRFAISCLFTTIFWVIFEIYESISAHLLLLEWVKGVLFIVILIILIGYRILKRIIPKKIVKEEKLE